MRRVPFRTATGPPITVSRPGSKPTFIRFERSASVAKRRFPSRENVA
jgi:hypothetical protein